MPVNSEIGSTANNMSSADVRQICDRYFDVLPATTPDLMDQIYALRYQVYCLEHNFEDWRKYPDGKETDSYDPVAEHIAVLHRGTGEVVATGRLILGARMGIPTLPLLAILDSDARTEFERYSIREMAEISRYIVSRSFRRRTGEEEFADVSHASSLGQGGRRVAPHLTIGLIHGLLQLGVSNNVRYFCASMRPALRRLLQQFGLEFQPIGFPVNHHGFRQPCIAKVADLLAGFEHWQSGERR